MFAQQMPENISRFDDPRIKIWKDVYNWLDFVDQDKVQILIDSYFENFDPSKTCRAVICTSYEADPRIENLVKLANKFPNLQFIWLTDSNIYDYPLPLNIFRLKYLHWYLRVKTFLHICPPEKIVKVKNKKIKHKFSSLSYYPRQNRALVTAALLTFAQQQSILSWHNAKTQPNIRSTRISSYFDNQHHGYLIDTLRQHPQLANLNWDFINSVIKFDDYVIDNNYPEYNLQDIDNPCYTESLCNFNNETTNFGFYVDDTVSYIRPGPYFTEKTVKPLVTGCVLVNSGQPFGYDFLSNDYKLFVDYGLDLSFDRLPGDFDRFIKLVELIQNLSNRPLSELNDATIDSRSLIQEKILSPEWMQNVVESNCKQDLILLEFLSKV
jgi:hypothetical protein